MSGNFNDWRFVCDAGFILDGWFMRVRMLIKLIEAELVNAIVAAISFGDGLAVFLQQVNLLKVGIHNYFYFNNLLANI